MGIRFFDYDDVTDRDVEIKRKDFELLLDICFRYSKYVSLIFREEHLENYAQLKPFEILDQAVIQNMQYRQNGDFCYYPQKDTAVYVHRPVKYFYCCAELKKRLLEISDDLWAWIQAWGFDNPVFYREDGSVFFLPVVHEGWATFYPRENEDISVFFDKVDFHTRVCTIDLSGKDGRVLYTTDADSLIDAYADREKICWTENDETVQYDVKSGSVTRAESVSGTDKDGLLEDGPVQIDPNDDALLLLDEENGGQTKLTFEEFAEMSDKTDELMQISKRKTWSRKSCTEYFFNRVYRFDGTYYVVGQIRNKGGDAIALVFRFDPDERKAEYITYANVGEGTWTGYELIPRFETYF